MGNVKHLNDKYSEDEIKYFIVNQVLETVREQYRQANEWIKEVKGKKSGSTKT